MVHAQPRPPNPDRPMPNPPDEPIVTPPDDTRHGPVPPMGPAPKATDPGRAPVPNREKVRDNPVLPPERRPFPEPEAEPQAKNGAGGDGEEGPTLLPAQPIVEVEAVSVRTS